MNYFSPSGTPIIIKFSGRKHLLDKSRCSAYWTQRSQNCQLYIHGGGESMSGHFLPLLLSRKILLLKALTHKSVFLTMLHFSQHFITRSLILADKLCPNQRQLLVIAWGGGWNTVVLSGIHWCGSALESVHWCIALLLMLTLHFSGHWFYEFHKCCSLITFLRTGTWAWCDLSGF